LSIRTSILTVSDRSARGERADASGPAIRDLVSAQKWEIVHMDIVPDDLEKIQQILETWANTGDQDIILTTGGTGFAPRDVTPEATLSIVDRLAPGITEAMRNASLHITKYAMLSRGIAGIRGVTLIVNLPGSPKAAVENLEVVLPVIPHAVHLLRGDPAAEQQH
jgi:molybdopterin adenylyltransferase